MTITTTTQIDAAVNNYVMSTFLSVAEQFCPYFVGGYEGEGMIEPNSNTFTAKWRRIEQLTPTTTALTALTGAESYPFRAGIQPSRTDFTATVQKYGQVVSLNEEVELLNPTQFTLEVTKRLAESAGRSLNRLQRNELEGNSTQVYVGDATSDITTADKITVQSIRYVTNQLRRNSAKRFLPESSGADIIGSSPIIAAYWGITHVDNEFDLRAMAGFKDVSSYSSHTQTYTGELGMVEAVRFLMTEEASVSADAGGGAGTALRSTSGSNADLYETVIFGQEFAGHLGLGKEYVNQSYMAGDPVPAVELISMARGSGGAMDPLKELATYAWKAWHAPKILNPNWGFAVRHAAGRLV